MPTVKAILDEVADYYGVRPEVLVARGRRYGGRIERARKVAGYLCRELTGKPLSVIGRIFGGRDHSMIGDAHRRAIRDMARAGGEVLRCEIEEIKERLDPRVAVSNEASVRKGICDEHRAV